MDKLNELAWQEMEKILPRVEKMGIVSKKHESGTLVLDAGVEARGGLEAGLAMARVGMAGLGMSRLEMADMAGVPWANMLTHSDHPFEACFLSQSAHWQVQMGDFHAMGSGPACLLNRELEVGKSNDYDHSPDHAVLILETGQIPDELICNELAEKCKISPDKLAIFLAPTSSLAGSAQIAARSIETALHKLQQLGFDLSKVVSGVGKCPIAPPTGNDLQSLGKTNDVVFFGCQVWLAMKGVTDNILAGIIQKIPAATSSSYGSPFLQTLNEAGGFYNIDPGLFAPAEITLTNLDSGKIFHAGKVDEGRLRKTLME